MAGLNDISRLPVWAQRKIAALSADLTAAEAKAFVVTQTSFSPIEVEPYSCYMIGQPRRFLPGGSTIRYFDTFDVQLLPDGRLQIHVIGGLGDTISVEPEASNAVTVRAVKR